MNTPRPDALTITPSVTKPESFDRVALTSRVAYPFGGMLVARIRFPECPSNDAVPLT